MSKIILIGAIALGGLLMAEPILAARRENDFDGLIQKASVKNKVPVALIKAVIRTESSFNPSAVNPSDPSAGLMQTTPATASAFLGRPVTLEELKDPALSIEAGTRFLGYLLAKYPEDAAIQMYNLGETKYRKGARVPEYLAKVRKNLAYYASNAHPLSDKYS